MKLIIGERGTGKTAALIRYASSNDARILCANKVNERIIKNRAKEMDVTIKDPMYFHDYINNDSRENYEKVVIDELEQCICSFLRLNISCATGTMPTIHPIDFIQSENLHKLAPEDYVSYKTK